jgi:hypothetical protein
MPAYSSYASDIDPKTISKSSISCKAKNFDAFLEKFTESIEMQKLCTRFPLEKLELKEEGEEMAPSKQQLLSEQITYPLILPKKQQIEQNLNFNIEVKNNKKAKVILYKPDTGYKMVYRFMKKNTWQLITIEDWAI